MLKAPVTSKELEVNKPKLNVGRKPCVRMEKPEEKMRGRGEWGEK